MPDITMCDNKECSLTDNCWRFNAPPDRLSQSYSQFIPDDNGDCDFYIPMDKDDFPLDYDENN
jgi:hypothetical protein